MLMHLLEGLLVEVKEQIDVLLQPLHLVLQVVLLFMLILVHQVLLMKVEVAVVQVRRMPKAQMRLVVRAVELVEVH